jgi:ribosome-associated protein
MRKTVARKTGAKKAGPKKAGPKGAKRPGAKKIFASSGASAGAKKGPAKRAGSAARGGKIARAPKAERPLGRKTPGLDAKRKALRPKAPADTAAAAPRAEPAQERPDPSRPRAVLIAQAGLDKKAEDVLVLDVRGLTSYADYFVLMTADSERQAGAIADSVDEKMKANGSTRVGAEGYETGRWILIDYGDVVAHVMSRDARGFYDLEGLWADAPRFQVAG